MLYFTLVALAVFNISIQVFMPYLILYYTVTLGMDNYVLIFAPAILLAAIFTALYGKVYDRKGFGFAIVPTLVLLMVGYVGLYFFRTTVPVFIASLLMMCGFLGTGAMLGAKVRTHTPENKSGMFQAPLLAQESWQTLPLFLTMTERPLSSPMPTSSWWH